MTLRQTIVTAVLALLSLATVQAQNSVLATGQWLKLAVREDGIYKITYATLTEYGLDPATIDPATLRLFGHGAGMLPQANSATRPAGLSELAIRVAGAGDGRFDPQDYILFWGTGPDLIEYDTAAATFRYQKHLFSSYNYYFLNYNLKPGLRPDTLAATQPGPLHTSAWQVYTHEEELFNVLHSGRVWYGENFDLETTQSFATPLASPVAGSLVTVISSVMSRSPAPSRFVVNLNGQEAGSHLLDGIPDGTYTIKGHAVQDTFYLDAGGLGGQPLTLTYTFEKQSGPGYLDFFLLQARVPLVYNQQPLVFWTGNLALNGDVTFRIENCPEGLLLWNITSHSRVLHVPYSQSGNRITFQVPPGSHRFVLFDPAADLQQPLAAEVVENQNLHGIDGTDLLIVTAPEFLAQATELATWRQAEGLAAITVTTTQIYNEFSSGKPDITAIRDFARYLYNRNGLRYLLLFGKGTYDPKDINRSGMNKVPIYQSRNSLHPLTTYGSDDYLGFLEDTEGEWPENASGNHTLDIGVGRLPVATPEEAATVIAKLKAYTSSSLLGPWRNDVVFVAENGDQNIHQRDAERLATHLDTAYAHFDVQKIYVDDFPIVVQPGGNRAPEVNNTLYQAIGNGALIINYTGHGNEVQWAKTRIFDKNMIDTLANDRLPLFVTATCEFGRHDDDNQRSGGEDLLVRYPTGAIGCITTTRPVFSSTNYQLNDAFYRQVFVRANGNYQRLGDIFRHTKNNSLNNVFNRNFSLLADPSMRLAYPFLPVVLDSLNGQPLTSGDTLKSLARLTFSGRVLNPDTSPANDFNGELEIVIYDKAVSKKTLGNLGGTPFTYSARNNVLFRGRASISYGQFAFTTILPKDISYNPGKAKIALYARHTSNNLDGAGANIGLLVGQASGQPAADSTPPAIDLYLGDTTYVPGLPVSASTLLIARIYDESGINTSLNQIGHALTLILDDGEPQILNDYFSTSLDDFTTGWLVFPLPRMSSGPHTLSLTAWDTFNNAATARLSFVVVQEGGIIISRMTNYPNPFRESTTFYLAHTLPGDDLEITLQILTTSGQEVYRQSRSYYAAPGVINDWIWDGRTSSGEKIRPGLYIYGMIIRSLNSNYTQKEFSRLFITN